MFIAAMLILAAVGLIVGISALCFSQYIDYRDQRDLVEAQKQQIADLQESAIHDRRFIAAYFETEAYVWECERDCSMMHETIPEWCVQWRRFAETVQREETRLRTAEHQAV